MLRVCLYKYSFLNEKIGIESLYTNEIIKLSKRECEILYLLALGKQPKEISIVLEKKDNRTITAATISGIINKQLYRKFKVYGMGQLLAKAHLLQMTPLQPDDFYESFNKAD